MKIRSVVTWVAGATLLILGEGLGAEKADEIGPLFNVVKGDKWGYIDRAGRIVIELKFEGAGPFSEGLAPFRQGGRWGFIDRTGAEVIKPQFSEVGPFSEGWAPYCLDDGQRRMWGYVDKTGKVVVPPALNWAWPLSDGRARIILQGKHCFCDQKDNIFKSREWGEVGDYSEGLAPVESRRNFKWGYIDKNTQFVIKPRFDSAHPFHEGLAAVGQAGKIDRNHKLVRRPSVGFIDKKGEYVIPSKFDLAWDFSEGLAAVLVGAEFSAGGRQGGQWGYIDKTGKLVIEPAYDDAGNFSEGMAQVAKVASWGFVDRTGRLVVEPSYDKVWDFRDGLARVADGPKIGYIDKTGSYVWKPQE
jgi:hypothetical protein